MIALLMWLLACIASLAALVCFLLVVVKMLQNQRSAIAILSIILLPVCGLGTLIAFVFGWMNAKLWDIQDLMLAFTAALAGTIVFSALAGVLAGTAQVAG